MHLSYMNGIAPLVVVGVLALIVTLAAIAIPDLMQEAIDNVARSIAYFFLHLLHGLWKFLAMIADFLESMFLQLAGINPIYDNSGGDSAVTDLLFDRLFPIFTSLVMVAFFLLVVFTILAIIRQHYKEKDGGNPYIIVFRMFKGLIMFGFVTAACVVGLYASTVILKGVRSVFSDGADDDAPMSYYIFRSMAYEGNRARVVYSGMDSMDRLEKGYTEDVFKMLGGGDLNDLFKNAREKEKIPDPNNPGQMIEGPNWVPIQFNAVEGTWEINDPSTIAAIDEIILARDGEDGEYLYKNWSIVEALYIPTRFNWIIGFGGIAICVGVYMNFTFGLIARLVELGTLYLFSPLTLAFFPFDDGQQFNSAFVKPFYKKTISVFAPVLAMNAFFIIAPIISDIQLHDPSTMIGPAANFLTSCIISLALLSMLPKLRNLIQTMLGADSIEEKGLGAALKDGWNKATAKNFRKSAVKTFGKATKKIGEVRRWADYMGGGVLKRHRNKKREAFKEKYNKDVEAAAKAARDRGGDDAAVEAAKKKVWEKKLTEDRVKDGVSRVKSGVTGSKPWKAVADSAVGRAAGKVGNVASKLTPKALHNWGIENSPLWNAFAGVGGWWEKSEIGKGFFELSGYSRYKGILDLEKNLVERTKIMEEFGSKINKPIEQGAIKRERKRTTNNDIAEITGGQTVGKDGTKGTGVGLKFKDDEWWKEQKAESDARKESSLDIFRKGNSAQHQTLQDAVTKSSEHISDKDARKRYEDDMYKKLLNGSPDDISTAFSGQNWQDILKARNVLAGTQKDENGNINTQNAQLIEDNAKANADYERWYGLAHDGDKKLDSAGFDKKVSKASQDLAQIEIDLNEYKALLNVGDTDFNAILDEQSRLVGEDSITKAVQKAFLRGDKRVIDINGKDRTAEVKGYGVGWGDGNFKGNKQANAWYSNYMHEQFAAFDKFVDSKASRSGVAVRDIVSKVHDRLDVQSAVKAGEEVIKSMIDTVKNMTVDGQELFRSKFLADCLRSGDMVSFGDECMKAFNGLPSKIESEILNRITKKSDLRDVGQIFQQVMGNANAEVRGEGNEKSSAVLAKMFRVSFINQVEEAFGATASLADQMQTAAQAQTENILSKFEGYLNNQDPLFAKYLEPIQHLVKNKGMMDPSISIELIEQEIKTATAKFNADFEGMEPDKQLLFQDFRADFNSVLGREQDNRRYRGEGDGLRAYLAELLSLPGDGSLRALLGRGANQTGSTA